MFRVKQQGNNEIKESFSLKIGLYKIYKGQPLYKRGPLIYNRGPLYIKDGLYIKDKTSCTKVSLYRGSTVVQFLNKGGVRTYIPQ